MAGNRNRTLIILVLFAFAVLVGAYTLLGSMNEGGGFGEQDLSTDTF